eukprot:m51a1_g10079 hypothetical protein (744) ;mRNA; r:47178-51075
MAIPVWVFRDSFPRGTDLGCVLRALRELTHDPLNHPLPSPPLHLRPWKRKERLWLHLWRNRWLWFSLLPSELGPALLRSTWLREASLCFVLGMHPRVGSASPVQLLSPLFAREFVCSFLAPPAAFVALFFHVPQQPFLKAVLERPGRGVVELVPPPLESLDFWMRVVVHTESVVALAIGPRMSLYLYDARTGELFTSLSLRDHRQSAMFCYHDASQRLAQVLRNTEKGAPPCSLAINRVGRLVFAHIAVYALPGVPATDLIRCTWSLSGRSVFLWALRQGRTTLNCIDVATGAIGQMDLWASPSGITFPLARLLETAEASGVAISDSLDEVAQLSRALFERWQTFSVSCPQDRQPLVVVDPRTLEVTEENLVPRVQREMQVMYGQFQRAVQQAAAVRGVRVKGARAWDDSVVELLVGIGLSHEEVCRLCPLNTIPSALRKAFLLTDRDFFLECAADPEKALGAASGCCALLVAFVGPAVYVANAGDCRCVLGRRATGTPGERAAGEAVVMSSEHRASSPEEQRRLSREHPGEPNVISAGRVKGRMQPTRTLGDGPYKNAMFNRVLAQQSRFQEPYSPPYLTAEPEVRARVLDARDAFVVAASDGLWELLASDEAAAVVGAWVDGGCRGPEDPACLLVRRALEHVARPRSLCAVPRRQLHDDITATVVVLAEGCPRVSTDVQRALSVPEVLPPCRARLAPLLEGVLVSRPGARRKMTTPPPPPAPQTRRPWHSLPTDWVVPSSP